MRAQELKRIYHEFFEKKGHKRIESAPLIPDNDPTVLFTTAGMHPLVPYLMGQEHPLGRRLVDVQRCLRTQDIDEVGDKTHTTFFEMLGNWSLGDYFKEEAIKMSFEFLTEELDLPVERLAFSCFAGDDDAPKDTVSAEMWKSLGVHDDRIAFLPKSENWWGPAGKTGPCGPDTEMFFWAPNDIAPPEKFDPEDKRWVEIWNDVFMQYNKKEDGTYEPLSQQNVDTGLGVERVAMVLQGKESVFDTELFTPIFNKITEISGRFPDGDNISSFRIIADHMRASTFILGDERGVPPGNVDQGYILRRFIRRTMRHLRLLGVDLKNNESLVGIAKVIIAAYKDDYPNLEENREFIETELKKEEKKFLATLDNGLKEFSRMAERQVDIDAQSAFLLYQSFGFPLEMIQELAEEKCMSVDVDGFHKEYERHKERSRQGAEQKFKGGLSEDSEITKRLHTATHILNEALRRVVDPQIRQKGSNITPERLRFDFNFDRKLTPEEIRSVEEMVNQKIRESIPVEKKMMSKKEALDMGAQAEFGIKYPDTVSVYVIDDFSKEFCGGPHVSNTREIGNFRILKEQSSAAGVRRIKAVVE
ncbi:MAG: alanine--tRNA ligase [Candidatus Woesearchaeota archaeon]